MLSDAFQKITIGDYPRWDVLVSTGPGTNFPRRSLRFDRR
jgi:hypothetical protein